MSHGILRIVPAESDLAPTLMNWRPLLSLNTLMVLLAETSNSLKQHINNALVGYCQDWNRLIGAWAIAHDDVKWHVTYP